MATAPTPIDRYADHFVNYLFDEYNGSRHVRRVATWLGFLLAAVDRVANGTIALSRTRQLTFEYRGHRFKAKYNHDAGYRGGIEIIEVLPGRGAPEGGTPLTVASLAEAEDAYRTLESQLDSYIDS